MATVTVSSTIGATCHYWFTPKAREDTNGAGVQVPNIVHGWVDEYEVGQTVLSLELDNAYLWDVNMTFQNAPPIVFEGLNVGNGGDLLGMLSAQGWQSLAP